MQLPRTLSPAFCCLLALAVQNVAGLVVPRGAPSDAIGAEVGLKVDTSLLGLQATAAAEVEVEVGASTPRGGTHRRQLGPAFEALKATTEAVIAEAIGTRLNGGEVGRRQLPDNFLEVAVAVLANDNRP